MTDWNDQIGPVTVWLEGTPVGWQGGSITFDGNHVEYGIAEDGTLVIDSDGRRVQFGPLQWRHLTATTGRYNHHHPDYPA